MPEIHDSVSPSSEEVWKPVVDFEGLYEVSNLGRVRSPGKYATMRPCKRVPAGRTCYLKPKILKPQRLSSITTYLGFALYKDGKMYGTWNCPAHRLVLEAFIGPCPEGMECCHGDGDPTNNRLDNLRWDTHTSNLMDRVEHGTVPDNRKTGEENGSSRFTENDIRQMRELRQEGLTQQAIADIFDTAQPVVERIVNRKAWKHVL